MGSWRALDIRGGDTVDGSSTSAPKADWRNTSADNPGGAAFGRHGTYWLAEMVSPQNRQLLAAPMKLWVAPSSPLTSSMPPGTPALYDYQGRLSMPVVGEGENATGVVGMGGATGAGALRKQCITPYQLPPDSQPACVMPTGWTMPVFDVKLQPLPHTGGVGAAWLAGGGAVVLAATLTLVWWWRRRNEAEKPHTPGGDAP